MPDADGARDERIATSGRSNGRRASRQRAADGREEGERLDEPERAAQERASCAWSRSGAGPGAPRVVAVRRRTAAPQGGWTVDEHAVRERHPAEAELLHGKEGTVRPWTRSA